jgi:hypothetical protein
MRRSHIAAPAERALPHARRQGRLQRRSRRAMRAVVVGSGVSLFHSHAALSSLAPKTSRVTPIRGPRGLPPRSRRARCRPARPRPAPKAPARPRAGARLSPRLHGAIKHKGEIALRRGLTGARRRQITKPPHHRRRGGQRAPENVQPQQSRHPREPNPPSGHNNMTSAPSAAPAKPTDGRRLRVLLGCACAGIIWVCSTGERERRRR